MISDERLEEIANNDLSDLELGFDRGERTEMARELLALRKECNEFKEQINDMQNQNLADMAFIEYCYDD